MIVGIVIGTTIFKAPGFIASQTSSAAQLLGLWALGGGLALLGALCYAELGATYGGAGGDYYYQTRAFGPFAGFLFGWTQFVVVQTVNIAMFATVVAEQAWKLWNAESPTPLEVNVLGAGVVTALTVVNLAGLKSGKRTQNVLTAAKVAGIALLLLAGAMSSGSLTTSKAAVSTGHWSTALIIILYAYGGWNDAAYVVADVRNRERNVPRALLAGVGFVAAVYLAVNAAYIHALGYAGLQTADDPPVQLMTGWLGEREGRLMSAIVLVSALGAVNGLILSVSRLHAAVGSDHRLFSQLGRWSTRHDAPVGALIVQAAFTVVLLMLVGTPAGRGMLDEIFQRITGAPLPWSRFPTAFDLLFAVGAPVFWLFFLLTGIALVVLRFRDAGIHRPFRVPAYPLPPILFIAMCVFGIWASVSYAGSFTWLGVVAVVAGAAIYAVERMLVGRRRSPA